jgi:hypothetical protein
MRDTMIKTLKKNIPAKGDRSGWKKLDFIYKIFGYQEVDHFLNRIALPLASHLHAESGSVGSWNWKEFNQRAGFMSRKQAYFYVKDAASKLAEGQGLTGQDFKDFVFQYVNTHEVKVGDEIEVENYLMTRVNAIKEADALKVTGKLRRQVIEDLIENNPTMQKIKVDSEIKNGHGTEGFQLVRTITPDMQQEIYEKYSNEYPLFMWIIDQFIDPSLASVRKTVNGVEIPLFNRFSLAQVMTMDDAEFEALDGYTPDVYVNKSIIGILSNLGQAVLGGKKSAGRRYKTGQAREIGNVRSLFAGFQTRAFQVLRERARQQFVNEVLSFAEKVPVDGVIPENYVMLQNGIKEVMNAIKRVSMMNLDPYWRAMSAKELAELQNNGVGGLVDGKHIINADENTFQVLVQPFPETKERLSKTSDLTLMSGGDLTYEEFLKEAMNMKGADLMLPRRILLIIVNQYATEKIQNGLLKKIHALMQESVLSLLVHPSTFAINYLSNKLWTAEYLQRTALQGLLKAMMFNSPKDSMRMIRSVVANTIKGSFMGTQKRFGTDYSKYVASVMPEFLFQDSTALSDLTLNPTESAKEKLARGEISSALLTGLGYGTIDIRPKQVMAISFLQLMAARKADEQNLHGIARKAFIESYVKTPSMEDRIEAVAAADFEYLNYRDIPHTLQEWQRSGWSRLFVPFMRFGYAYMLKNKDKLWDKGIVTLFKEGMTRQQRADALGNALWASMVDLGLAGFLTGMLGSDEEPPEEFVGTSTVKRKVGDELRSEIIDTELNTSNRVNATKYAPLWFRLWLENSGIINEGDDGWIRLRSYPSLFMSMIAYQAGKDIDRYGAEQGIKSYAEGITGLAADFFNLGFAFKSTGKLAQALGADRNIFDTYSNGVPIITYTTMNLMDSFVPFSRQADEFMMMADPVRRRIAESKTLGFNTTPSEQLTNGFIGGHVTGLIHRLLYGGDSLPYAGKSESVSIPTEDGVIDTDKFGDKLQSDGRFRTALSLLKTPNARKYSQPTLNTDPTFGKYESERPMISYVEPPKERNYNLARNLLRFGTGMNVKSVDKKRYSDAINPKQMSRTVRDLLKGE